MADAVSFIAQFHGLTGNLLRERKRSLHVLLQKYRSIENNEDILKEICTNLQPKTYLEETYKLEFLLFFKRAWELFEFVKDGNDKLTNKIIRQKWFLTTILKDVTPQELVKDIFPQLSLVVRLKILKQILKHFRDEKFINSLFQELLNTYGLKPALVIFSGCSVEKIKEVLTERGLKIPMAQLKLLHDKDRSLTRLYYEEFHKRGGDMNSLDSFSRYLSRKDPSLFMELRIKYGFFTSYGLGRQATSYYVKEHKDSIIGDPVKYLDLGVLKQSVLVRQLSNEFPGFLKAAFPGSLSQLRKSHIVFHLLDDYPKKRRYYVFSKLFREVYNKELISVKEVMTERLLEIIPSHEEREKWVDVFDNEVKYIQFKRSTLAIPELKELLFRADNIASRMELFDYIINTCRISEDYDSLLDILKLICKRYRNDDTVLTTVLNKIKEKMDLYKLTEEHWEYIHEIMLIENIKNLSVDGEMIMEYSKFLYKSGKPFEELIPLCIKSGMENILQWKFVDAEFRDENFLKDFLKLTLKHYPNVDEKNKTSWSAINIVLIIKKWNKNHPNDVILASEDKTIIKIIQEAGLDWIYRYGDEMKTIKYLICVERDAADFENMYFENLSILSNLTITRWFLKNKPEVFEKYIDKIYTCFIHECRSLTTILKKLEYLGLVKTVVDHYSEMFKGPDETERDTIAQFLTSVMPTNDYLELLQKYIPAVEKQELSNASEEEKTLLQIEISVAQTVRFSTSHAAALPILFNYCKGDCLQPALHSLYSCFNRIPEKDLKSYLSKLMTKPVSLRKHAIFLAALVFPVCVHSDIGEEMMKNEKDISVQKHLFSSFYKYFLKTPSDQLWDMMQKYMESLSVYDKESLNLITNIHDVPEKFKNVIAEKVWMVLEKLENKKKNSVKKYYTNFFTNITDYDVEFLTLNFCVDIIKKKMFEEGYKRNPICFKFSIQFMMYGKDMQKAIEEVMQILHEYKSKYWTSEKSCYAKSTVYNFCSEIFNKTMNTENLRLDLPRKFVLIFSEEWKNIFTQQETFEEYLMLEFMLLKYEKTTELKVIAQKVSELFEIARRSFGDLILDLFKDFLKNSLNMLLGDKKYDSKLMEFLKYFAEEDNISSTRCLLIISILPRSQLNDEFKKNYNYVLSKIQSIPDPIISMSLNKHFKKSR